MLQAKVSDTDREAIKSKCRDCPSMRQACDENVQWQATMSRSGQEALRFLQDVVFFKTFDNVLKGVCKAANTNLEVLMELDSVNERWQQVVAMRQNEIAQEQAMVTGIEDEAEESHDDEAALAEARKAPNTLQQGSPSYWRAVANKSVRMYLTFVTEGKNDSQLQLQVSQWQAATGLQPEIGKKTILVHLDTALLGESSGPHCQPELRGKRWKPVPCLKYFFPSHFFEAITFDSCFHSCRFRTVTSWRSLLLALVSAWAPRQWTRFVAPCLQKALSWLWWTRWALAQSFSRRLPSCLCG